MYDSGDYTVEQIAKAFKTTRPTIYRSLKPDTIGERTQPSGAPSPDESQADELPADWPPAHLPVDTRPLPSLDAYDQLLPSRRRENPGT